MAWFDILGGVAAGAEQGIGALKKDLQQRKENTLAESQDRRAQAALVLQQKEEERRAKAQRDNELAEQAARMDPSNVDPEWVASLGPDAKFWVNKTANGFALKEDPLKVIQRRAATLQAEDAPDALKATQLGREVQTTDARTKLAAVETWNSPRFAAMDDNTKIRVGTAAGKDPQEIMGALRDPSTYINRQPGVAAVREQVRGTLAGQAQSEKNANIRAEAMLAVERLKDQRLDDNQKQQAIIRFWTSEAASEMTDDEKTAAVATMLKQAGFDGKPQAAPDVQAKADELMRKYGAQ